MKPRVPRPAKRRPTALSQGSLGQDDPVVADPKSPRRRFRLTLSQRVPLTIAFVLSLSGLAYTAVAVNAVTRSLTDQSEQEVHNMRATIGALGGGE